MWLVLCLFRNWPGTGRNARAGVVGRDDDELSDPDCLRIVTARVLLHVQDAVVPGPVVGAVDTRRILCCGLRHGGLGQTMRTRAGATSCRASVVAFATRNGSVR